MGNSKNNQTLAGVSLKYIKCGPKVVTYIIKQIMQVVFTTKCIHKFEQINYKDFNCFQLGTRLY